MTPRLFTIFYFLLIISSVICTPNVEYPPHEFFPVEDVTNVTWAHGVNSQALLTAALRNDSIRMLEADLCKGWLNDSGVISPWEVVIMAHPPANFSDLSFISFIDQVIAFNSGKSLQDMKGIKLDFKDYFSAAFATMFLRGRNGTSNGTALLFPVWLNADVVSGPVNSTSVPKVDGVDLLKLHSMHLPDAVLSLGWTTKFGKQSNGEVIATGAYTREDVDRMIQVFRRFSANPIMTQNIPVTFAVRAALAQNSLGNLLYLMNATSQRSSITLWSGADDPKVNTTLIFDMFKVVGKNRVFVDLPYDDWQKSGGILITRNFSLVGVLFIVSCHFMRISIF